MREARIVERNTNLEGIRLALPASVFVEAVKLALVPRKPIENLDKARCLRCASVQPHYAAVDHLTAWWNETAPTDVRSAFSFMLYVKMLAGVDYFWASGDREEGYVSEATMARHGSGKGEARILGNIILVFYRAPTTYSQNGFSALKVDGSHGVEGGLPAGLSGEELVAADAYDALHDFPTRFADLWKKLQNG
ncbi:hypothetical protein [Achromobacter sp. 2789STDY5608633]|jgi:hypothetical protein|uniref:hypothetical protein n=1 Tax=Achromobacter sp. 2789STDY5608633 TaxID=1806501 RepID=UPI0009E91167|nr:hypothetical protein [Achromobacter sp. 2789STDY5608633]